MININFSDYLIFVDESGDHKLDALDEQFPVFSLAFCIISKKEYIENIVPAFLRIKMKYWGHDHIVFHERDIRKEEKEFTLLRTDKNLREGFFTDLNSIIQNASLSLVAAIIHKHRLKEKYLKPYNPYELALLFCMERSLEYLCTKNQQSKKIAIQFESRGKREDNELREEFKRICENKACFSHLRKRCNFKSLVFEDVFVDKKSNSTGLQLADLFARPLALYSLKPEQPNRALAIMQEKIWEIKHFP